MMNLDEVEIPSTTAHRNCNNRKDRDKRKNRHTCGIFIGWVGYILLQNELDQVKNCKRS